MKYYGYELFSVDVKKLIQQTKKFNPEVIIGIARGGLTLSHMMAQGHHIRNIQIIRSELYDKSNKRDKISIFGECNFQGASRVLVVDDIADSGATLEAVMTKFLSEYPEIEFRSATLFYKKTSCYEPYYWINDADDWIDFFWERDYENINDD